jgi:hypothetical protein
MKISRADRWMAQPYYGETHLFPILDKVIHTIPVCACGPTYQVRFPHGPNFYRHNAVDARED